MAAWSARGTPLRGDLKAQAAHFTVSETLEHAELARAALLHIGSEDPEIELEHFRNGYYRQINR